MPLFDFPFRYGSVPDVVSVTTAAVTPARWTNLGLAAKNWIQGGQFAVAPRLERVYPQLAQTWGASINFAHRAQSQFPVIVKTGNQVYVASTITSP